MPNQRWEYACYWAVQGVWYHAPANGMWERWGKQPPIAFDLVYDHATILNQLGQDGWECVSFSWVVPGMLSDGGRFYVVLKRPLLDATE